MSQKNNTSLADKQARLDELLAWFEGDSFAIAQAAEKIEEAGKLADDIEHELTAIENTITVLKQKFDQEVA